MKSIFRAGLHADLHVDGIDGKRVGSDPGYNACRIPTGAGRSVLFGLPQRSGIGRRVLLDEHRSGESVPQCDSGRRGDSQTPGRHDAARRPTPSGILQFERTRLSDRNSLLTPPPRKSLSRARPSSID